MLNALFLVLRFLILLFSGHKQVALENVALRHQLAVFTRQRKRPRLRDMDRLFWIALKRIWKDWRATLVIVQPETVIAWQRKRFKRYWWGLSQRKGPGRPPVHTEIRKLVRTMMAANPLWGAPRVHGELLKLGFEISERTVSRLMPKKDRNPTQTWMTFLRNRCCRVRLDATPGPDSESGSEAGSQPSVFRSHHRRFVHSTDASGACSAVRYRPKDLDSAAFSQNAGPTKVSAAVLTKTSPSARSQRTDEAIRESEPLLMFQRVFQRAGESKQLGRSIRGHSASCHP